MGSWIDFQKFTQEHGANPISWNAYTLIEYQKLFTKEEVKEYRRRLNAILQKRTRIKKRLMKMKNIYFSTYTISNEFIGCSKGTFERKIKEVFNGIEFVANEDYGKTSHRLHYHILHDNVPVKEWPYGYTLTVKCKNLKDDVERLARYCVKLANHSIKEGSGKLIYSRSSRNEKKEKNIENN